MARPSRWKEGKLNMGFIEVELSSWKYFPDYINQEMLTFTDYVYRGHADSRWKLEPTLDRIIKSPVSIKRIEHLERFKFETRGRRGANPPILKEDNDWWALGQHHGLKTPLLDWTESPFVGLYFATAEAQKLQTKSFSVFSLWQSGIELTNKKIIIDDSIKKINNRKPTIKMVRPLSDENSRLVSQRGLFTRGPNNMPVEEWTQRFSILSTEFDNSIFLMKLTIPNKDTNNCLRYLNRMNINHSTLFPDLTGASEYSNKYLTIEEY